MRWQEKLNLMLRRVPRRFEAMAKLLKAGLFTGCSVNAGFAGNHGRSGKHPSDFDPREGSWGTVCLLQLWHDDAGPPAGVLLSMPGRTVSGIKRKVYSPLRQRYSCACRKPVELKAMIETECRQLGLLTQMKAIIEAYRFSRGPQQISLF